MSAESPHQSDVALAIWRPLSARERALVDRLIRQLPREVELREQLSTAVVRDMQDGGMGSLRFRRPDGRVGKFGVEAAEVEYTDDDRILVSITLNLDEDGYLFELDFWKTDFSELVRYPRPEDVTSVATHSA